MLRRLLLSCLVLAPGPALASETHCHDAATRQDCQECVAKHPDDTALQTLHALWMDLCVKVRPHELTTQQAIDLFEHLRQRAVERLREYDAGKEQTPRM
jgi:hypothetical protein